MTSTLAPRIEVYTILACRLLRPDIYYEESLSDMAMPYTLAQSRSQLCAADPVVQAAVAKFTAGVYVFEIQTYHHSFPSGIIFDVNVLRPNNISLRMQQCQQVWVS
jgi:hypothetical protein